MSVAHPDHPLWWKFSLGLLLNEMKLSLRIELWRTNNKISLFLFKFPFRSFYVTCSHKINTSSPKKPSIIGHYKAKHLHILRLNTIVYITLQPQTHWINWKCICFQWFWISTAYNKFESGDFSQSFLQFFPDIQIYLYLDSLIPS